jgi:dipeptidyl aminopeptidase/acylaminoacyl peptidase
MPSSLRKWLWTLAAFCVAAHPAAAQTTRSTEEPRPARIEDLFALRDLGGLRGGLAISADERSLAVFERETDLAGDRYRYRLMLVDADGGTPARAIGDVGGFVVHRTAGRPTGLGFDRIAAFSRDGAWVYYLAERDGRIELWRASTRGPGSQPIAQPNADIRRFALTADGRAIVFETNTPRDVLAAKVAENERQGFRIDDAIAPSFSLMPLPDEDSGRAVWRLDLASGLSAPAQHAESDLLDVTDEPAVVRPLDARERVQSLRLGLFYRNEAGETQCMAPECSGALKDAWTIGEGRSTVVFRRLEGHAQSLTVLYVWRPLAASTRLIRREEELLTGCVAARAFLYCLQETPFQPRRLVAIDGASGELRVLYDPNPQWRRAALPRVERMDYTDAETNESFARLVYPLQYRASRRYPLIVMQYRSRGFLRAGTGGETPVLPLSARGYFVLTFDRPEFRSREAHQTPREVQRDDALLGLERSAKREAVLHFLGRALATGSVDSRRIAIAGTSDGAELAYHLLMDQPDLFAAAVMSTPPTDPIAWPLQSERFRRQRFADVGMTAPWGDEGAPWTQWWRRSSAFHHAERLNTPILLNLAESEALRAFPLIARLRETTTPIEAFLYPGAYHIKARPQQLLAAQERTLAWLDFWLLRAETGDHADPNRLDRWRSMRARMPSHVDSTVDAR